MMSSVWQDLRYGARSLRRQPGFTAVAVLTLALGVGATTTVYSVVKGVLLDRLPYPGPERLVVLWSEFVNQGQRRPASSPGDFLDFRERAASFEELAALYARTTSLTGDGEPEQVRVVRASHNLVGLLGVAPALGRNFRPEEDVPRGPKAVILTHGLWQRRYGGDPRVLGRVVQLNGEAHAVVGVLPAHFRLLLPDEVPFNQTPDLLVPLQVEARNWERNYGLLTVLGRLKPGVPLARAQSEMDAVAEGLRREHRVHETMGTRVRLVPLHEDVVKHVRPAVLVLFGAVGLLLLSACCNVANLLLARALARRQEVSIRAALGAGRARIVRQVLTETVILGLLGGAAGVALAFGGVELLAALKPSNLPRLDNVAVDKGVLALTAVVTAATSLLFGLAPAVFSTRVNLTEALRGAAGASGGRGASRLRGALVVSEVALSLVLLTGAGLLARSLFALREVHPGFEADGVMTFKLSLPPSRYAKPEQVTTFLRTLEEKIKSLPGVESAGAINFLPLSGEGFQTAYAYDEATEREWESAAADRRNVTPGYFSAMKMRPLAGRLFDERDAPGKPFVVVVDENLARRAWPGQDAVGKRIQVEFRPDPLRPADERRWAEVIGVVGHVRNHSLRDGAGEQVYYHYAQQPVTVAALAVRAAASPDELAKAVEREARALDRELPLYAVRPMRDYVSDAEAQVRFALTLLGAFGLAALLLASVGVYGVLAYAVRQRTREMAIRAALGARRYDILKLVLLEGMALTVAGAAAGTVAAYLLSRFLASLVYGISTVDLLTFTAAPLVLAAAAAAASLIPARRAASVDPAAALRHD